MSHEKEYELDNEVNIHDNINSTNINNKNLETHLPKQQHDLTVQYKLLAKDEQKKFLPLEAKELKRKKINKTLSTMVIIGAILAQLIVFAPEAYQPYFFLFFLLDLAALGAYGFTKYHNLNK